jgi:hypothetical protein
MTFSSKDSAKSCQSGYIIRRSFLCQALFVTTICCCPTKVLGLQSIRVTKPPSLGRRQVLEPKPHQIRSITPLEMTASLAEDDPTGCIQLKTKRTRRIHPTKYDQPAEQINKRSFHTDQTHNNAEDENFEDQPKLEQRIRRTARIPFGGPLVAQQNGALALVVSPDPSKNQLQKIFRQAVFRLGKTFATYVIFALVCEDVKAFLRRDPINLLLLMCIWSATSVGST